jgi:hypothetical protein
MVFYGDTQLAQAVNEGRGDVLSLQQDMTKILSLLQPHQLPAAKDAEAAVAAVATVGSVDGATSRAVARYGNQHPVFRRAAAADPTGLSLPSDQNVPSPYLQTFPTNGQGDRQLQPISTRPSLSALNVVDDAALSDVTVALSPQLQQWPVNIQGSPSVAALAPHDLPAFQHTVPALSNKGSLRAAASVSMFARKGPAATTAPAAWQQTGEVILAVSSPRTPVSQPPRHMLSGGSVRPPNGTVSGRKGATSGFEDSLEFHRKVRGSCSTEFCWGRGSGGHQEVHLYLDQANIDEC